MTEDYRARHLDLNNSVIGDEMINENICHTNHGLSDVLNCNIQYSAKPYFTIERVGYYFRQQRESDHF